MVLVGVSILGFATLSPHTPLLLDLALMASAKVPEAQVRAAMGLIVRLDPKPARRFADAELAERRLFGLPPFGFQAAIRADALDIRAALQFLQEMKEGLAAQLPESVAQMGPAPMLMVRLAERERAQLFLEAPSRKDLHHALALWGQALAQARGSAAALGDTPSVRRDR